MLGVGLHGDARIAALLKLKEQKNLQEEKSTNHSQLCSHNSDNEKCGVASLMASFGVNVGTIDHSRLI